MPLQVRLIAGLVGLAIIGFLLYALYDKGYDDGYLKRDNEAVHAYSEDLEKAIKNNNELQDKISKIDTDYTKNLKEKQDEIDRLRSGVSSGRVGLRVPVVCPKEPVPGSEPTTPSAGGDNAGTGELAESARSTYFALREGIARNTEQLLACQRLLLQEREVSTAK